MDKPVIGIRQADGSFYAIMDDTLPGGHKRLVLSAARTDQSGVKIDLFRSTDGTFENAVALGSIPLSDPHLGNEDIELTLDLDDGVLQAAASVAGQPPQTLSVDLAPFQSARSDSEILADDGLADAELDELDFPDPDFAPVAPTSAEDEPGSDLDLDAFDIPEIDAETAAADLPETSDTPDLDDLLGDEAPAAQDSFDLSDLDAGFGPDPEPEGAAADVLGAETPGIDEWEKISLDDLESMEFMDTGDEISAPTSTPASTPASTGASATGSEPDFRMDEDQAFELGDLDDLGDLPGLDDADPVSPQEPAPQEPFDAPELGSLDKDFMDLESGTEPWTPPVAPSPEPAVAKKAKAPRTPAPQTSTPLGGLDKTALFLSLAALSLLVLLILVLLFLNLVKAPTVPVIQPEVLQWKAGPQLTERNEGPVDIDLGAAAPSFVAATVLEVPQALKAARIARRLAPGETVEDVASRFGAPARIEGDRLLW